MVPVPVPVFDPSNPASPTTSAEENPSLATVLAMWKTVKSDSPTDGLLTTQTS